MTANSQTARIARYYHTARTAHLERLEEFTPGDFYYTTTRADFDLSVTPPGSTVTRVGLWGLLRRICHRKYAILEVPEPMAIRNWPQLLTISIVMRLQRRFSGHTTELVAYCIENYPADEKLREFTGLPLPVCTTATKSILAFLYGSLNRVAFGTKGAEDNYFKLIPERKRRDQLSRQISALPSPRDVDTSAKSTEIVFLGTFEERKGFDVVCRAWPLSVKVPSDVILRVMGKGELLEMAIELGKRADVDLILDPPRKAIWDHLGTAKVLILPSQPARGFREQVGLPIVEALSSGCQIVTTSETGIADWLVANGHEVLPPNSTSESWADAIGRALQSKPRAAEILESLPAIDGRIAADLFLTGMEIRS